MSSRRTRPTKRPTRSSRGTPPPRPPVKKKKLRLKPKPFLTLLGISLLLNMLLLILLFIPSKGTNEEVASVGKQSITREEWMNAMENEIGRETLQSLVNEKVMEAAAKKYGLTVSEKEIDLEIALLSATDGDVRDGRNEEDLRQKIRSELILEKVLTNDIVVKDKAAKAYYKKNEKFYNVPESYRTFGIIIATEEEAKKTKKELKDGSHFETLARERSLDAKSANLGGDLGFLNEFTENVDRAILQHAPTLKEGKVSDPIELTNGQYAILLVEQVVPAQSYDYDEVKAHIKRLLAMEQLPQTVKPEMFWKDFKARWVYGK